MSEPFIDVYSLTGVHPLALKVSWGVGIRSILNLNNVYNLNNVPLLTYSFFHYDNEYLGRKRADILNVIDFIRFTHLPEHTCSTYMFRITSISYLPESDFLNEADYMCTPLISKYEKETEIDTQCSAEAVPVHTDI